MESARVETLAEQRCTKPTLTRLAAQRLRELANAEIPLEVRRLVGLCLLDHIGACISGLSAPWASALLHYAQSRSGAPEAHLWGSPLLVSAEVAAFTNSALGHSIIRDDMHLPAGSHIGVMVIPAALALAQRDGWSGRDLVRGLVAGYEMAVRLGVAVRSGGKFNPHFRPSGITGAFGAAAAAIAGTGLEENAAVQALGFAANAAAGLNEWPWAGGQEICTHMGTAARGGIASFDLAQAGMRSSESILEGRDGLFAAYGAGIEGAEVFKMGMNDSLGIRGVRFKPVAGCNMIQTPLAAALDIGRRISGQAMEIEEIVITTTTAARDYPGCDSTGPFESIQQSKMSLQYGVSSAILFGRVDEDTYMAFANRSLQFLMKCCQIKTSPEYDLAFSQGLQPALVQVICRDGTTYRKFLEDVPWLQEEDVISRFRHDAASAFAPGVVEEVARLAATLWEVEDCNALFRCFSSGSSRYLSEKPADLETS